LELLVDQHSIYEKGCISEFFAVSSIYDVYNSMEARKLANYFFLGNVISEKIIEGIIVSSEYKDTTIIDYRGYCFKLLTTTQIYEKLCLSSSSFSD
jgi:hypothetical protein